MVLLTWVTIDFVACSLGTISVILVWSAMLLSQGLRYVVVVCEVSSKFLLVKYFYLYTGQE